MYLLFLDESGRPEDKSFVLGGIAVRADEWRIVRDRLVDAVTRAGWPADRELKWHGIRKGLVPGKVADAAFAALAASPVTCFACALRPLAGKQRYPEMFATPDDTYATGLMLLAERFQLFLAHQDSYGLIVLDSRRPELDDRMRRFFERLREEGSAYLKFDRLVDCLMFAPSHFSIGLQMADLVVGVTHAGRAHPGEASNWLRQLKPRFARHPARATIDGVGIKEFPELSRPAREGPRSLFR